MSRHIHLLLYTYTDLEGNSTQRETWNQFLKKDTSWKRIWDRDRFDREKKANFCHVQNRRRNKRVCTVTVNVYVTGILRLNRTYTNSMVPPGRQEKIPQTRVSLLHDDPSIWSEIVSATTTATQKEAWRKQLKLNKSGSNTMS